MTLVSRCVGAGVGMMGSGPKGREGLWPRPTPWPVVSPRGLSEPEGPDCYTEHNSPPPWAVVRWKRGQLSVHLLVAELTESSEDKYA